MAASEPMAEQTPDGEGSVMAAGDPRSGPGRWSLGLCCIWLTGGMLTLPLLPEHQIAKANSLNATATRRVTGSSTASS